MVVYYDKVYVEGPRTWILITLVPSLKRGTPVPPVDARNDACATPTIWPTPRHLVADTGGSNRSKSDRDPAQWLPPASSAHCRYVAEWTSVEARYGLVVDAAEKAALTTLAAACPNGLITYTPAD